jgi:hypothetical protein
VRDNVKAVILIPLKIRLLIYYYAHHPAGSMG